MASLTVENYVKTIFQLCSDSEGQPATTGAVAAALQVSPSTVTSMLKTLRESDLADYTPYGGVRLTENGKKLALRVLRRHRLIELFLVRTLELTWDEVHEEAENMEHAVSDLLVDRIDRFLGNPQVDPHGDPIPAADGSLVATSQLSLAQCAPGFEFQVQRVTGQAAEFLRFLSEQGLMLESRGVVLKSNEHSGTISVLVGEKETTFSRDAAEKVMVVASNTSKAAAEPSTRVTTKIEVDG